MDDEHDLPTRSAADPAAETRGRLLWFGVFLVLVTAVGCVITSLFSALGPFAPVFLIGGVIFAVTGLHYFVWGWWLGRAVRADQERPDQEAADQEAADQEDAG